MQRTILVLTQVYVPDPAAVGQQMADAAAELARRGYRVIVMTSDRGYDDPSMRYSRREIIDGVQVRRIPWASFGKRSIAWRLLGGLSFTIQVMFRGLALRRLDAVLVSTVPPMASLAAVIIGSIRRVPIKYWVMDLNPDQLIALNVIQARAVAARALDWLNRLVLKRASDVVALDRFMAERINRKVDVSGKLAIIPPWPLEDRLQPVDHSTNPFRSSHGLRDKFVIMYSGNHGPSNPFTTILAAAKRLADLPQVVFLFVGGGIGKAEVEASVTENLRSLPYQPLEELQYSLSAADVHLVTVGDSMVGIVHPCKVYGAFAVGRPVLLLGPEKSHVGELLRENVLGWRVSHGDVDGAERILRDIARMSAADLAAMGTRARELVSNRFSKSELCGRFCNVVERGLGSPGLARKPVRSPA